MIFIELTRPDDSKRLVNCLLITDFGVYKNAGATEILLLGGKCIYAKELPEQIQSMISSIFNQGT